MRELPIVDQQLFHERALAVAFSNTISARGIIVLLKRNQDLLLDLADFIWQERPEDD